MTQKKNPSASSRLPISNTENLPIVLAFGKFRSFHKGHEYYLTEAAKYGKLAVVLATDETIKRKYPDEPGDNEETRLAKIRALPYVYTAMIGSNTNPYNPIRQIRPDVICLGHDADRNSKAIGLEQKLEEMGIKCKIVYIKDILRRSVYSSESQLAYKRKIKALSSGKIKPQKKDEPSFQ